MLAERKNIKFVSKMQFAQNATNAKNKSRAMVLGRSFNLGLISFAANRIMGYIASRICTVKLWICIKLASGSFVHVGKSKAAIAAGIHTVYKKLESVFIGFIACMAMIKILILQRWRGRYEAV